MKKRALLFSIVLVVILSLTIVAPTGATYVPPACQGCTPGYWKQPHHFDSWGPTGYAPGDYMDDALGVGPHITLLDALKAKGGKENAFMRHFVAAILNYAHPDIAWTANPMNWTPVWGEEWAKDELEEGNEMGCPLN